MLAALYATRMEKVAVSKHHHRLFLGSDLKNIISCEKKILLVKLCFFLHVISDFIPLDPDPRTQINPDPHHWFKVVTCLFLLII